MKQKFSILFGLLAFGTFVLYLWWQQAVKPPNSEDKNAVVFTINRGEDARSIADRLRKQNLIRSPVAFFLIARFGNLGDKIQSGEFRLSPSMDLPTLTQELTHGTTDVWITIPEGWRNEEIALTLTKVLNIPENEFTKVAQEGFMFPDTYQIPKDATAQTVVKIFKDNFDKKVTPEKFTKANEKNLTKEELITIASLVEREAKFDADRPIVASVILNRLRIGMKLDIDATIQYALGYQTKEKSWWKKELTAEDIEFDSPYNTYKNPGLPPSPICNPGLEVIDAVISAPKTDYLYYLSDKSGKIHFANTIEEHKSNIQQYLNK